MDPGPEQRSRGAALAIGAVVDKKYVVERVLGEGGMGVVYLARDKLAEAHVVLKAILRDYAHRADYRERILAEGRALARIDHPNVVRLNAIVIEDDALYLVMQFIEGEAVSAIIDRHVAEGRSMPVTEALRIFRQAAEGVAAAHREGIIHRDLKPANILVRARDGVVKVTDFGIAKEEVDAKEGRGKTIGIIGSLPYMAPEQCRGGGRIDKRADIYALGIVLFELLTGRVPFHADGTYDVMRMHIEEELPSVAATRSDVPAAIDAILRRACAKEPDSRFASCEELLAAVDRVRAPEPLTPADEDVEEAGRKKTIRLGLLLGAVGAAAVLGAHGMGWIAVEPSKSRPVTSRAQDTAATSSPRATNATSPTPASSTPASPASAGSSATAPGTAQTTSPTSEAPRATNLAGEWKSDSGRVYDVVWNGNAYEFRIRDATQFPSQGYENGEPRFLLRPIPDEMEMFLVEDRIRPFPPEGTSYEASKSRESCVEVWTTIGGRPLRAQLDGERLWVRMARLEPDASMFKREGSVVVACKGLKDVPATEVDSFLLRQR